MNRTELRQRLTELAADGATAPEAARQIGLTPGYVRELSKSFGLTFAPGKRGGRQHGADIRQYLDPLTDDEVRELLVRCDNSLTKVAREMGVSKNGLWKALNARGIHSVNLGGNKSGLPRGKSARRAELA